MKDNINQAVAKVYNKRCAGEHLSNQDLHLLLADTIVHQQLFMSPDWNWTYGGVRYVPSTCHRSRPDKILVLQWPSALGDTAMCTDFFSVLAKLHPHAEISFLAGNTASELHTSNSFIDVLIDNPLDPYLSAISENRPIKLELLLDHIEELTKLLESYKYDLLVNLQVVPMSAVLAKLIKPVRTIGMTLSHDGMPVIYGNIWGVYLFSVSANLIRNNNIMHRSEMFCRMIDGSKKIVSDFCYNIPKEAIDRVQSYFDSNGIKDEDFVVGLGPLSKWSSKVWDKYDVLSGRLEDEYGAKIVMFGAKDEARHLRNITEKAATKVVLATHFNIGELLAAICGCDLFISNDTGSMHLACSLRKKVIALFGPTSVYEVGPWVDDFVAFQSSKCNRCHKPLCDKDSKCMDDISVGDVIRAVEYLKGSEISEYDHNTSSSVNVYLPEQLCYSSRFHDLASKACLSYFEMVDKSCHDKSAASGLGCDVDLEEVRKLLRECISFETLLKELLYSVKTRNWKRAQRTARDIAQHRGLLKNIEIVNSMKYLDKRDAGAYTEKAFKQYCQGMLDDVRQFLRLLKRILNRDFELPTLDNHSPLCDKASYSGLDNSVYSSHKIPRSPNQSI